jgi:hypothetical protein
MADHKFNKDAGAALVFALLYGILFVWMLQGYIVGRYKVRSRWSLLFFHVTIRVASQVRVFLPFSALVVTDHILGCSFPACFLLSFTPCSGLTLVPRNRL